MGIFPKLEFLFQSGLVYVKFMVFKITSTKRTSFLIKLKVSVKKKHTLFDHFIVIMFIFDYGINAAG